MKLSISNIGWMSEQDASVFTFMKESEFDGLEIAPTRLFAENPYDKLAEAQKWSQSIRQQYGFVISSMQSIWFGRQEKLFGADAERAILTEYTKKAMDFAKFIGCQNLVFGCPRNRVLPDGADHQIGVDFFRTLGEYAARKGTVISMEANPPIYNTNYINDTASALRLVEEVSSDGFKLNLDLGTMIYNDESVDVLIGKVHLINHVHISEPGLKTIERRRIHQDLKELLLSEGYDRFISIEMGKTENLNAVKKNICYVKEIFA